MIFPLMDPFRLCPAGHLEMSLMDKENVMSSFLHQQPLVADPQLQELKSMLLRPYKKSKGLAGLIDFLKHCCLGKDLVPGMPTEMLLKYLQAHDMIF